MVHTHTSKDRDRRNQPRDPADVLYSGSKVRIDAPILVPTSTINWWPYPPWGQSTVSPTPSVTTTASISRPPVAVLSASPPASTTTTSSSEATSSSSSSPAPSSTVISVTGSHGREVGSQTHRHPGKRTGSPRSLRDAAAHFQRVPRCSSASPRKSHQALYNQI